MFEHKMRKDGQWFFYRDTAQMWRWELHDDDASTLAKSMTGFGTLTDCVEDAVDHGYVGGGQQSARTVRAVR